MAATELKRQFTEDQADAIQNIAWCDWDHATMKARLPDFRSLEIDAFIEKYS
ncbi:hypothetical protein [Roseibium algae]|uniref:hypothetical protein n=1 Tax=Roseibium algae TaxID=3123038 RepID=UPI003BF54D86